MTKDCTDWPGCPPSDDPDGCLYSYGPDDALIYGCEDYEYRLAMDRDSSWNDDECIDCGLWCWCSDEAWTDE